jgi:hypothetical protein
MKTEAIVRTTDSKARISLPRGFADVTVLIEQISDSEIRIRKAKVVPENEVPFSEELLKPLSDRDRDFFLSILDNPPPPSPALIRMLEKGRRVMEGEPIVETTLKEKGSKELVFGKYSPSAVLRWMGKNGFTPEDAARALKGLGVSHIKEATIPIQVKAGAKGERAEPAHLTKEEAQQCLAFKKS